MAPCDHGDGSSQGSGNPEGKLWQGPGAQLELTRADRCQSNSPASGHSRCPRLLLLVRPRPLLAVVGTSQG